MKKIAEPVFTGVVLLLVVIVFAYGNLFLMPKIQYSKYHSIIKAQATSDSVFVSANELTEMKKKALLLKNKIDKLTPGNAFLMINTTENSFKLYQNNQVIRQGICSTGSFIQLEVDSTQIYTFETPKGALSVRNKITNPVWHKPDWAFIEEGLPVPPSNHSSRYEKNVLGDYALNLGNGYLIHGTLYQRLLGLPVTHGCVRMGDEDLEIVFNTMQVGSKVFIY